MKQKHLIQIPVVVVFDVSDESIANPKLMLQVQTGFFGTETGLIKIAQ